MKILTFLISIILLLAGGYGLILLLQEGIHRSEIAACTQLRHQADVYPTHLFYITKSQDKMCNEVGLPVIANVAE